MPASKAPAISSPQLGDSLASAEKIALHIQKSGYWSDAKDLSKAVTKIMIGQSLGIDPLSAMSNIILVQGKPQMSAHLMGRLIKASGKYRYKINKETAEECSITLYEKVETGSTSWEWFEHAPIVRKREEYKHLFKNPTWQQYPRNMLFARTLTDVAKFLCADVMGGSVYLPDELPGTEGNVNPETLEPIDVDTRWTQGQPSRQAEVLDVDFQPVESSMPLGIEKAAAEGDSLAIDFLACKRDLGWAQQIVSRRFASWDSLSTPEATLLEEALTLYKELHPGVS